MSPHWKDKAWRHSLSDPYHLCYYPVKSCSCSNLDQERNKEGNEWNDQVSKAQQFQTIAYYHADGRAKHIALVSRGDHYDVIIRDNETGM